MSDSTEPPGDPLPPPTHELDDNLILSASENTNNENREIEIRNANSGTVLPEDTPATTPSPSDAFQEYAEHVTYEDGVAVYTDPNSKVRYKWDKEGNKWTLVGKAADLENEHYRWDPEKNEWVLKETIENEHYRWCHDSKQWLPKAGAEGAQIRVENGERLYTDKDGMTFFWDTEKNAWFPKITDDFMAMYQMNYGFIDNTTPKDKEATSVAPPQPPTKAEEITEEKGEVVGKLKRKAVAEPPKWFELEPEHNTKVYVSNLPLDITDDEFVELMSKCGMITRDIRTQKLKIRLYLEPDGSKKGDGLCDYIKLESVELALNILDGMEVRGKRINVTRAKFQMRGDYDPKLKPRKKQKKEKEKEKKLKEKLFDWRPEKMRGERGKHERIIIVKNLFAPETFERKVQLILEYQQNLREECKKCGSVRRVVIYDRHPEGVAQVTMADPEEADIAIQLLHNRQFGERKLTAETWDGKTRYRTEETEEDAKKRISQWNEHLAKEGIEDDSSDEEKGEVNKVEVAGGNQAEAVEDDKGGRKEEVAIE